MCPPMNRSSGQAWLTFLADQGACEYYAEPGDAPGRWHGAGLADLGLTLGAEVKKRELQALPLLVCVVTAALRAGLVDELVLHQVPILLGAGRPFFQSLPEHVKLRLVEAVAAPGVTRLHYEVAR